MKLGAENKVKTVAAVALMIVAAMLLFRMLSGLNSEPAAAAPAKPAAPSATAGTNAATTQQRARRVQPGQTAQQQRRVGVTMEPSLDPRLRLELLKASEEVKYSGTGRDIFGGEPEPEIPKPVAPAFKQQQAQAQVPQGPPPPPPIPLKFFGWANRAGEQRQIFLMNNGDVLGPVGEGQIVERRYRVVKINKDSVEIEDVLGNNRQTIPMTQG